MKSCKCCIYYDKCQFNDNYKKLNLDHAYYCDNYRGSYELIKAVRSYKAKLRSETEQLIRKDKKRESWLFDEKSCKDDFYYRARKEFFEEHDELDEEDIDFDDIWNI